MKKDIYDKLREYSESGYVPMHMPGAKRNTDLFQMVNPYAIDITEIDGFDNMHHATDIIKDGFKKCARLFGADESLYLINGSSAGLLSAICGATHRHDKVIVARNAHKSVYNAIYMNELEPVYIYPEPVHITTTDKIDFAEQIHDIEQCHVFKSIPAEPGIYGKVSVSQVEEAIKKNPDATAVIITSPTYEGIVSDIKAIAAAVHQYNMVLIVDEAHGAHFNFSTEFPDSAVKCGADAVIQSIHKTLPSFTQTALLHLNGTRINRERVRRYWDIYQTTSPSYLLMGGIDHCMTILEDQGKELFENYLIHLKQLRAELKKLKHMYLLETDDISKIVILVSDAKKLYDILINKYRIQLEMSSVSYVIAMTSIGDKKEYYDRFLAALQEIDKTWNDCASHPVSNACVMDASSESNNRNHAYLSYHNNMICSAEVVYNLYDAENQEYKEYISLKDCCGKVSAEGVCFYPPGIPVVNPGERITEQVVSIIEEGIMCGLEVMGLKFPSSVAYDMSDISRINIEKEVKILCLK